MTVRVIGPKDPVDPDAINTTSRSSSWSRGLSPFFLGPVPLYTGSVVPEATNVENGWQFSKVYPIHISDNGDPTEAYFTWARAGWRAPRAFRYPMGKGARPEYSWWGGEKLPYLEARKRIYFPMYARAVVKSSAFKTLLEEYRARGHITLWDFDGYDHRALGMTFDDVLACPTRTMGHAFILAMMLERFADNIAKGTGGTVPE